MSSVFAHYSPLNNGVANDARALLTDVSAQNFLRGFVPDPLAGAPRLVSFENAEKLRLAPYQASSHIDVYETLTHVNRELQTRWPSAAANAPFTHKPLHSSHSRWNLQIDSRTGDKLAYQFSQLVSAKHDGERFVEITEDPTAPEAVAISFGYQHHLARVAQNLVFSPEGLKSHFILEVTGDSRSVADTLFFGRRPEGESLAELSAKLFTEISPHLGRTHTAHIEIQPVMHSQTESPTQRFIVQITARGSSPTKKAIPLGRALTLLLWKPIEDVILMRRPIRH